MSNDISTPLNNETKMMVERVGLNGKLKKKL